MTVEEVKAWLNLINGSFYDCDERSKAIRVAIQALDENKEYRAIGTVKEIKIREAQFARLSEGYLSDLTSLREYQAIGTIDEFKALKEKSEPKKINNMPMDDMCLYYENHCPNCDSMLVVRYKHCPKCGQKLDWSE